jgi:hypothetical protein
MHAGTVTTSSRGEESLAAALRPLHKAWVEDARRFLDPTLGHDADFWTRWAAVRYICDDLQERYHWERALVSELRPFIRLAVAERLVHEGERVSALRLELDRIGRRRGTAAEFAAGAGALLEQLGLWCAEIERAAEGVPRDVLTPEGSEVLMHLEAAGSTPR